MKIIMKYSVILTLTIITISKGSELPSNFKICKRNDPNLAACVNEAAAQAIIAMSNGIPSLNVVPVEPLFIDHMNIGNNGNLSVARLEQNYNNIHVHGLTKGIIVTDYNVDFDNLIFKSESFNPEVVFKADCQIDGSITLFTIRGNGPCDIKMSNLTTSNIYYGEKYEKDGEIYMRIKKYVVKFAPDQVRLNFARLFSKNLALGTLINGILNANSKEIFKELQGSYEETFANVFTKIGNNVFSRIPFDKIFPA